MVQRKERELSHVAPALTLLLQHGAKWNSDDLLDDQKTPYHIICESPGDHHELLDLMIKSSQRTLINTQDSSSCTAVVCAVQNANVNCLKCLFANGAEANVEYDKYQQGIFGAIHVSKKSNVIMDVISIMRCNQICNKYRYINEAISELLLDNSPIDSYKPLITFAVNYRSVYCIKKLVEKGARLDSTHYYESYVWSGIAKLGNVELLKFMFKHGIDKDITDQDGLCILWYVVMSNKIDDVRYLLDLGVVIPTYTPEVSETQCEQCKDNTLIVDDITWTNPTNEDPCKISTCTNNLEIVKLLEEYGSQSCKSFNALRRAVICVDVTRYLLNNYKYPLNIEYTKESDPSGSMYTLLTESRRKPSCESTAKITKLLLDHGADPVKQMCSATSVNAVMSALADENLEVIAQYIHSGVDVSFRSYDRSYGMVLPFEASVLRGCHDVAEMFLISRCSCGVFSWDNNHMFKNNVDPEVEKLMKKWHVQENNVIPLQQRCRYVILNHLSPRADKKIGKLQLPTLIIKFLSIPEIDDIIDAQYEHDKDLR